MNRNLRGLIRHYSQVCKAQRVSVAKQRSCESMQTAADNHELSVLDEAVCDHAFDFIRDMENPSKLFGQIYDKVREFRK